jgi:hypothetical protein
MFEFGCDNTQIIKKLELEMYSEFKIIKFQNQSQERKMIQHFEILIEKKKKNYFRAIS